MKICNTHFADLRAALNKKGLGPLMENNDDRAVAEFALRWLQGTASMEEFDPLVVSVLEITSHAKTMLGIDPQDPRCPLCAVDFYLGSRGAESWIDNVTDLMLLTAKVNHLA